jgi:hypothetical protein
VIPLHDICKQMAGPAPLDLTRRRPTASPSRASGGTRRIASVEGMRLLVVTSCTFDKAVKTTEQLTVEDFDDPERLRLREAELGRFLRPAGTMYTGGQHMEAMRGVAALRTELGTGSVKVAIVSAGTASSTRLD